MKTTGEMIQTVFRRAEEYKAAQKARRARFLKTMAVLGCLCLLLATVFVIGMQQRNGNVTLFTPETTQATTGNPEKLPEKLYHLLIDVNPSICLSVNEADLVMSAEALNGDGEEILTQAEVEGRPLEEAVKEVSDALVDLGYISEEANSILISLEGTQEGEDQQIKEQISEGLQESLGANQVEAAIILQTVSNDSALAQQAANYGISIGKAQLINQILDQNAFHTFEELAALNIHELNLLKVSYYIQLENAQQEGEPGSLAYIGQDQVARIASADAGAAGENLEVRLECRAGAMAYCVTFEDTAHSYRYYINAVTGEILSADRSDLGQYDFPQTETDNTFLGEHTALEAALSHAGMTQSTLIQCKQNTDWVDGKAVYNLFFTDGRLSGRYVVDARDGQILQYSVTQEPKDRSVSTAVIGHAAAKSIALAQDGLVNGNVSKYELNLIAENGVYIYDLTFICNAATYHARLNAADGVVVFFEKNLLRETGAPSVETGANPSQEAAVSSGKN